MIGKKTIIGCLLPAYLMLVLHAIVPHHHHYGSAEESISLHHSFDFQSGDPISHHDDHDTDCCDKTHNFTHAPEQGEAMISSELSKLNRMFVKVIPGFLLGLESFESVEASIEQQFLPPANSFYSVFVLGANSRRGPPSPELMA